MNGVLGFRQDRWGIVCGMTNKGEIEMKKIAFAFAGLVLLSTWAHAAVTLDAAAVRKLVTGNTANGVAPNGATMKNYFAPDGKLVRQMGDKITEGSWTVNDDGSQCVAGVPGGCATIVKNDDGSYDRVLPDGKVPLKWTSFANGKDF